MTTVEIKIRGYHEDRFGHVNNARYLELFEAARWEYLEERGLTTTFFEEHGIFPVVARISISYRRPASIGDRLHITASVIRAGHRKFVMGQEARFAETGDLCAEAEVTAVFVDKRTGRPAVLSEEILDAWPELRPSTEA